MRNDEPFALEADTVAAWHYASGEPTLTWFALADGVDIRPGDWFVLRPEDGLARLAVDGDGDRTKFAASTARIPAGTLVSGDHPAGTP